MGVQTDALPLPRRVQLAVVAHIRHMYTDYDRLLKEVPWQAARLSVEQQTLSKLAEWRGERDDPNALEEILREVIVISEDEDDDREGASESNATGGNRLTQTNGEEDVEVVRHDSTQQPVHLQAIDFSREEDERHVMTPANEGDGHFQFIGHGQYSIGPKDPSRIRREEARRFQAWEEARDRNRRAQAEAHDVPTRWVGHGRQQQALPRLADSSTRLARVQRDVPTPTQVHAGEPLPHHDAPRRQVLYEPIGIQNGKTEVSGIPIPKIDGHLATESRGFANPISTNRTTSLTHTPLLFRHGTFTSTLHVSTRTFLKSVVVQALSCSLTIPGVPLRQAARGTLLTRSIPYHTVQEKMYYRL